MSVSTAPVEDVVVSLSSDDTTEVTVPASVTIPAGLTSADFDVTIIDDTELDGMQLVTVSASAAAFVGHDAVIAIGDNDSAFAAWASAHGLTGSDALPTADPDGDGISNLMEYGSNLDPTVPDRFYLTPGTGTAGLPHGALIGQGSGRRLSLEFVRLRVHADMYTVECCSDLGAIDAWQPAAGNVTVTPIDAGWERVIVEDAATVGTHRRRFIRLRINEEVEP